MKSKSKPLPIASVIPTAVRLLKGSPTASRPPTPQPRVRTSTRVKLEQWIDRDTQIAIIAIAAETNRDVATVTRLAINLFRTTLHKQMKELSRGANSESPNT